MTDLPANVPSKRLNLPAEVVEAARRIVDEGTAENTRRAYQGDLRYFWTWAGEAAGVSAPAYPTDVALIIQFITEHVSGLAADVDARLAASGVKAGRGPHRLSTVRRRLSALSSIHAARGLPNPCRDPRVQLLLRNAARADAKRGRTPRKMRAATRDVLDAMLATCDSKLIDVRDRAILLVGAASGGRRRSELAGMGVADVTLVPGGFVIRLRRSKTDQEGRGHDVPVLGRAADALREWLSASNLDRGALFRSVTKGEQLGGELGSHSIARIIKKRARLAGFDPSEFGGHSLRSGFVTESGRQSIQLADVKALSGHRSDAVATGYYQQGALLQNPAARVFD